MLDRPKGRGEANPLDPSSFCGRFSVPPSPTHTGAFLHTATLGEKGDGSNGGTSCEKGRKRPSRGSSSSSRRRRQIRTAQQGRTHKKKERQIPLPSSAKSLPDAKTRTTHDAACLLRGASAFLSAHKSSSFFLRRPPVFGVTSTSFHLLFLPPLFCKAEGNE